MAQLLHKALWLIPPLLQAVIGTVMVVRGLNRRIPYFFSYTTFVVLSSIALLLVHPYPGIYFWCYWIQNLISWILGFAVIYEIYARLLSEYPVLQKVGAYLFWFMGVILVMIALWTGFSVPGSDRSRIVQTMLTLERSTRIVECGLLVALFVFASFFGLSWKNYLFGVALGFAIFLSTQLAVVAIRAYTGPKLNPLFSWMQSIAYTLGILVWTFYVLKAWRPADLRILPKTELVAWNDTLQELLHR